MESLINKPIKQFLEVTREEYIEETISPILDRNTAFGYNPTIYTHNEYVQFLKHLKEDSFSFEALMQLLSINQTELGVLLGLSKTKMSRIINGTAKLDYHEGQRLKELLTLIYHGIKAHDYVVPNFVRWFYLRNVVSNTTPFEDFASNDRDKINQLYQRLNQKIAEVYV